MNISFSGGSDQQRELVRKAVEACKDRHLNIDGFQHTWDVEFLAPGAIDTTPHDHVKTFMVTQGDGTTQIRNDMPFNGQGPFAGVRFFQESVVHELGHHLLGNDPGQGRISAQHQQDIAELFDTDPGSWNPQDKPWEERPVEGIAETFKDCFCAARRREYFNRTNEKLLVAKYPAFRKLWRATTAGEQQVDLPEDADVWPVLDTADALGDYPFTHTIGSDLLPNMSRRARLAAATGPPAGGSNSTSTQDGVGTQLRYIRNASGDFPNKWFADHDLSWTYDIDDGWFPPLAPPTGAVLSYKLTITSSAPSPFNPSLTFNGTWERSYSGFAPGGTLVTIDPLTGECWSLRQDAAFYGAPPVSIPFHQIIAELSTAQLFFNVTYVQTDHGGAPYDPVERARVAPLMANAIPVLPLHDPGVGHGEPSAVPVGAIVPQGEEAGRIRTLRPVTGGVLLG